MLFAVSASQGIGKTTLLDHISRNLGMRVVERKTSRSILSDWNVSLSQVNNDRELTVRFQDEILRRKVLDEAEYAASDEIVFTERSAVDLFVFANIAIGKDNEYSDWLDGYYQRCIETQHLYTGVFYLTGNGRIAGSVQADGVRGANKHYAHLVDVVMQSYAIQMCGESAVPLCMVDTSSVDHRVADIAASIQRWTNQDILG